MIYRKEPITRKLEDERTYGIYVDLTLDEVKAVRKQSDNIGIKMSDYVRMALADMDLFKTKARPGARLFDYLEDERLEKLKEHLRNEKEKKYKI